MITTFDAQTLCQDKTPHQCELEAEAAERDNDWRAAAAWWLAAQYVTSGQVRRDRYVERERAARSRIGKRR
ncbi:MAG: hypothetical protein LC098_04195 [Burkholderiales bacterium]|nr:hypothetical protein [Burkholderiales bacterium]